MEDIKLNPPPEKVGWTDFLSFLLYRNIKTLDIYGTKQHFKSCQFAFTLAEVLITLGIIGVIAAITLPALIVQHQKTVTVSRLKKVYSVFSQALIQSESINGSAEEWISTDIPLNEETNSKYFNTYWKPFLKISKVCTDSKCGYDSNGPWKYNNGQPWTYSHVMPSRRTSFYLNDGTFVLLNFGTATDGVYHVSGVQHLIFDINGSKNPNTLGKDVFRYIINLEKHNITPLGNGTERALLLENCKDTGEYCAALIMHDSWQIKKDYSW